MSYEMTQRRKEYRERKHKTGEHGEGKLVTPTPNREKDEDDSTARSSTRPEDWSIKT